MGEFLTFDENKLVTATEGHDKSNPIDFDAAVAALKAEVVANRYDLELTDYDLDKRMYLDILRQDGFPKYTIKPDHAAAFDALKEYVAEILDTQSALPIHMRAWIASVMRGEAVRPKLSGGTSRTETDQRFRHFSIWLWLLSRAGMKRTGKGSASDAIATALNATLPKKESGKWTAAGVYQATRSRKDEL